MKLVKFNGLQWGVLRGDQIAETVGPGGVPTGKVYRLDDVQLYGPAWPSKIVCSGPNYTSHLKPGQAPPPEPQFFLKAPSALAHPGQEISFPGFTQELYGEVELAVVIGKRLKCVSRKISLDHVLGYTVANDFTAKDRARSDLQWIRAKSADSFCPLGPWIETDLDPGNLVIRSRVNGILQQESSTASMLFSVSHLLSEISQFMTLEPGDVVLTGSPKGAPRLRVGDTVEVEVQGIGVLQNRVVASVQTAGSDH